MTEPDFASLSREEKLEHWSQTEVSIRTALKNASGAVDAETAALLSSVEFQDVCITSQIEILTESAPEGAFTLDEVAGVAVVFAKAQGQKCQRSWKILPEVGQFDPPDVCQRCSEALAELKA